MLLLQEQGQQNLNAGGYMFGIGMREIIIVLLVAVLIFGYKKLPEIGSALGKAIKGFKQTVNDDSPNSEDSENKDKKE